MKNWTYTDADLREDVAHYRENEFGFDDIEDYVRTQYPFLDEDQTDEIIVNMNNTTFECIKY